MTTALTSWKAIGPGLIEHARQSGHPPPAELTDPDHPPTPEQIVDFVRGIAATYFPGLAPSEAEDPGMPKSDSKRGKD